MVRVVVDVDVVVVEHVKFQHVSCDVLRVGQNDLQVHNYSTDEKFPFLG